MTVKWKKLSRPAAAENLEKYFQNEAFLMNVNNLDLDYQQLGIQLRNAYSEAEKEASAGNKYLVDLLFGMKLYNILNSRPYNMTVREASDDGIWRFISVEVIPDIIYKRWGVAGKGLPLSHFYKNNNRNYPKSLWWYIYLSYQQDDTKTFGVLRGNTTDAIVNLVERTGAKGYKVELYREIMRLLAKEHGSYRANDGMLFRRVMVLNTARGATVEPALYTNGIKGYVKELYSHFSKE